MKKFLLLSILLFGCKHVEKANLITTMIKAPSFIEEPDFTTKHEIKVWIYDTPVTREQFERATDIFILGMSLKGVDPSVTIKAISPITIEWTSERIMVSGYPNGVAGLKIGQQVTVQWRGKISNSSLYHEWLHAVLFTLVRTPDPDHTSLWWEDLLPELKQLAADAGI
jgi:hypothetical protein